MAPVPVGTPGVQGVTGGNVANPATLLPGLPSGYATGDTILCFTCCRSATPTVATPAGWTLILNVTGTYGRLALFARAADGSETGPSVTWSGLTTGTAGTPALALCFAVRGLDNAGLVDVVGAASSAAASTTSAAGGAAISTLTADDLVLSLATRQDDAGTWTAPSGFTSGSSVGTTSGADMALAWAWRVLAAPGSQAAATFALAGASSFASSGVMVALKAKVPVTHFGVLARPITFGATIDGFASAPAVTHYGQLSAAFSFAAQLEGRRTALGRLALPIVFGAASSARRTTFGQLARPITVTIVTDGFVIAGAQTYFGSLSFPIGFGATTQGRRKTFSALALPITFGKDVKGQRRAFGQLALPIVFGKAVQGRRKTFGVLARPITVTITTAGVSSSGPATRYGALSLPISFGATTQGRRKTFSALALPLTFGKSVSGRRQTFGQLFLPVTLAVNVNGTIVYVATVLNLADAIYLGDELADAVYAGSNEVWRPA